MATAAFFRRSLRHRIALRIVVTALALGNLQARAGNESPDAPWSAEARVDRLLWSLVNDERYSHLQIAANYERLRTQLLDQACPVSAAPCLQSGETPLRAHPMTPEIAPEREVFVEQLLDALRRISAANTAVSVHLMVSTTD